MRRSARKSGWDHPRIRGEHVVKESMDYESAGSSPHTRGARRLRRRNQRVEGIIPAYAGSTLAQCRGFGVDRGIIPAYAGSTACRRRPRPARSDHPRIRGEHGDGRGDGGVSGRIIPAYAGSTASQPAPSASAQPPPDHPRIRGEHCATTASTTWTRGSSPHTRGAQSAPRYRQGERGIIPAYAGSTAARA